MIKLELPPKPLKLTEDLREILTKEFVETGRSVWNASWLKQAVFSTAFGKCCYSEIRLGEESKYMEVEHFLPKTLYPNEVVKWGNLLPSCKKCNAAKGDHDTFQFPIINPFVDNPKNYFYFENAFYKVRNNSEKGKLTLRKLGLNDYTHFVIPRTRISEELSKILADLYEDISNCHKGKMPSYIIRFKRLLRKGNRQEEYSALVSTVILSDENYKKIEKLIVSKGLWDKELDELKTELDFCSLLK